MKRGWLPAFLLAIPLATGCATSGPNTQSGAILGAGLGAIAGAIIGHQTGRAGSGAAVGAGLGAIAGGIMGNAVDRTEYDSAIRARRSRAEAEQALREVRSRNALSLSDIVQMANAGVSDEVIIAKIDQSNATFDLSSSDIIRLERSKVSDRVIEHMLERSSRSDSSAAPSSTTTPVYRTVERVYTPVWPRIVIGGTYGYSRGYHFGWGWGWGWRWR